MAFRLCGLSWRFSLSYKAHFLQAERSCLSSWSRWFVGPSRAGWKPYHCFYSRAKRTILSGSTPALLQFNLKFKHIRLLEVKKKKKKDRLSEFDDHLLNPVQAVWLIQPVRSDEASHRWGPYVPLISFSFLNQRRSAAGLLPWVMQVRVMWSPSRAGFVRPLICGFSGTPEEWNRITHTHTHTPVVESLMGVIARRRDCCWTSSQGSCTGWMKNGSGIWAISFKDQLTQIKKTKKNKNTFLAVGEFWQTCLPQGEKWKWKTQLCFSGFHRIPVVISERSVSSSSAASSLQIRRLWPEASAALAHK